MVNKIKNKILNWTLSFLEIQLLITLFCIPIFIKWGIAVSAMSFLGNLIFSPILAIFLILSAFIEITQIFCIPNSILKLSLEIFTEFWIKLIYFGQKTWMIGIKDFLFWPSIIIFIFALITIYSIKTTKNKVFILFLLMSTLLCTNFLINKNQEFKIEKNKNCYIKINEKNKFIQAIDNGALSNYSNNFIKYKLIPEINKKCGRNKIDLLKIKKLTPQTYQSLRALNNICLIKRIKIELPEKGDYKKAYALIKN